MHEQSLRSRRTVAAATHAAFPGRLAAPLLAIVAVFAIYLTLLAFYLGPLNGFWSSDQGTKLIQTQSLLLTKYRTNALIYPGETLDNTESAHCVAPIWSATVRFIPPGHPLSHS